MGCVCMCTHIRQSICFSSIAGVVMATVVEGGGGGGGGVEVPSYRLQKDEVHIALQQSLKKENTWWVRYADKARGG